MNIIFEANRNLAVHSNGIGTNHLTISGQPCTHRRSLPMHCDRYWSWANRAHNHCQPNWLERPNHPKCGPCQIQKSSLLGTPWIPFANIAAMFRSVWPQIGAWYHSGKERRAMKRISFSTQLKIKWSIPEIFQKWFERYFYGMKILGIYLVYQRDVQFVCSNAEQQIVIVTAVNAVRLIRNKTLCIFQRPNEINDFDWPFARTLFVNVENQRILRAHAITIRLNIHAKRRSSMHKYTYTGSADINFTILPVWMVFDLIRQVFHQHFFKVYHEFGARWNGIWIKLRLQHIFAMSVLGRNKNLIFVPSWNKKVYKCLPSLTLSCPFGTRCNTIDWQK